MRVWVDRGKTDRRVIEGMEEHREKKGETQKEERSVAQRSCLVSQPQAWR